MERMEDGIAYSEIVAAPLGRVWEHLLYKIAHPAEFVPGVSKVTILAQSGEETIRQMTLTMPDRAVTLTERITATPYTVRFEIVEHPDVQGFVENCAEAVDVHTTRLTYKMRWQDKRDGRPVNNATVLENAVRKSKGFIENHA